MFVFVPMASCPVPGCTEKIWFHLLCTHWWDAPSLLPSSTGAIDIDCIFLPAMAGTPVCLILLMSGWTGQKPIVMHNSVTFLAKLMPPFLMDHLEMGWAVGRNPWQEQVAFLNHGPQRPETHPCCTVWLRTWGTTTTTLLDTRGDPGADSVLSSHFPLAAHLGKTSFLPAKEGLKTGEWCASYCSSSHPPGCSTIYSHKGRMNPVSPNNRNVRGCRGFAEINAYWNFNMAGSINFDSNFLCGRVSLVSSFSGMILYHLGFFISKLWNVDS